MKKFYRPHAHLSLGEVAIEVEAGTLGELIETPAKARYKTRHFYHHRTEERLGAHCKDPNDLRDHVHCFKRNCTCECHLRGGK